MLRTQTGPGISALLLAILASGALIGSGASAQGRNQEVVVSPLGGQETGAETGITQAELEDQIRRFADRYTTRLVLAVNTIQAETETPQDRLLMVQWKSTSVATIVELAIGQNAVTSLLDMMVLNSLTRLMLEDYWIPERLGETNGQVLLEAATVLEEDIWTVADQVLTADQQTDLLTLVNEWHAENPDQIYPWYVRLSEFAGQRAADLQRVQQTGGMLRAVREAGETVEQVQAFGERTLFYLQRAPMITSWALEGSVSQILQGPEISSMVNDVDRFTTAVEQLVDVVAQLPFDRLAAIDQLMEQIGEQREAFFRDLQSTGPDANATLAELRQTLETFEKILVLLDVSAESDPTAEPFNIKDYQVLAVEATNSASEMTGTLEAFESLLGSPEWNARGDQRLASLDQLAELEEMIINRAFLYGVALIFVFFVALLAYRFIAHRAFPR